MHTLFAHLHYYFPQIHACTTLLHGLPPGSPEETKKKKSTDRCAYADYHVLSRVLDYVKIRRRNTLEAQFDVLEIVSTPSAASIITWKLLEMASPSKNTRNGHLKQSPSKSGQE